MIIDFGSNIICRPFAHLVIVFLNYYSHCVFSLSSVICTKAHYSLGIFSRFFVNNYSEKRTSVTVLIPLFTFSLTTHCSSPLYHLCFHHTSGRVKKNSYSEGKENAVAASAESFDNCHSSSPIKGPGANNLSAPPNRLEAVLIN
jgi:hypothetical protein